MFFQVILILLLIFFFALIFTQIWSQKHSAINEEPYRELQNDNDQARRNVATLSIIAHFYISIIDQKNNTIF